MEVGRWWVLIGICRVSLLLLVMLLVMLSSGSLIADTTPLADPTRPLAAKFVVMGRLDQESRPPVLGSILISPGRRLAIINNRRYAENDSIGDYRVSQIGELEVILVNGPKTLELRLASRSIKGPR